MIPAEQQLSAEPRADLDRDVAARRRDTRAAREARTAFSIVSRSASASTRM